MRSGPGTHFHTIQALADGTMLTILDHPLKGLRVQDIAGGPGYWWNVRTATGVEGWVSQYYLASAAAVDDWQLFE